MGWVNYATTHHPPSSTTTHHQPKYIHHPPPTTTSQNISTTTHHYWPPAKIHLPPPTTTQKIDHHPAKAKVYSYVTSFCHCFNSFFFFEMQYFFLWWRFFVIKFWSVCFSNLRFLLHFTFKVFWSLYFKSLKGYLILGEQATEKDQLLSLFSFKWQFNMFLVYVELMIENQE